MTGPQIENGFIRIAAGDEENDVFAALARCRLTGIEFQIALWVIRQTWGYGKKEDWISLSQFEKVTGASRSYICRAIDQLVTRSILVTRKSPGQTFYRFNKTFKQWIVTPKSLVTRKSPVVTPASQGSDVQDNKVVTRKSHTKENITKETIQKKGTATQYGNAAVSAIIKTMTDSFGPLDDTKAKNRQYAWLLLKKAKQARPGANDEEALDSCLKLIRAAARHEWWRSRITTVEIIYRKAHQIANALRDSSTPKVVAL